MTIYDLNEMLGVKKEVSKNEVVTANLMMMGLIWKDIKKGLYVDLAMQTGISEKRLQNLRNGIDTDGSGTVLDKKTYQRLEDLFGISEENLRNGNELWCREGSEKRLIQYRRLSCLYNKGKRNWSDADYLDGLFDGEEYQNLVAGIKERDARKKSGLGKLDAGKMELYFQNRLKVIRKQLIEELTEDYGHTANMDRDNAREYKRVLYYFKFGKGNCPMQLWIEEETERLNGWDYEVLREVGADQLKKYLAAIQRQSKLVQAVLLLPDKMKKSK